MSQSTDAILFFGVALPEDFEAPWADDFDKWMAAELGVKEPDAEFNESSKPLFTAYRDAQRAILRTAPVELVLHCSGDYPMYALAVRGTPIRACRGDVESVAIGSPDRLGLLDFIAKYKIPCERLSDIEWKLASYWG